MCDLLAVFFPYSLGHSIGKTEQKKRCIIFRLKIYWTMRISATSLYTYLDRHVKHFLKSAKVIAGTKTRKKAKDSPDNEYIATKFDQV